MFNNEDVTVGSWMLAMNVEHEDNRAICDPRCTPTSIAVWDIPKCSGSCFRVAYVFQHVQFSPYTLLLLKGLKTFFFQSTWKTIYLCEKE